LLYWLHYGGGFTKMTKKSVKAEEVKVRWDDVIGMEQAKTEAIEVVKLLKDHARVKKIGGKMLRGLLMMGPPGCGKTYLAKAIATESDMPFLSIAGSEFVEMFVGVGASRVRQLFKKARKLAYANGGCIVFIDEIDSVARKRVFSVFGGTEETNSTQNQLLAELDGLGEKGENVVVLGATNAPEQNMDEALQRPGRFDRKIYVTRPDVPERELLFKYYLSKVTYDQTIDIKRLARKAIYKTPADISNIVQEAALISTRDSKDAVDYRDLMNAMDRIDLGFKHKVKMNERERTMTAFHEAGHAVVMYYIHPDHEVNYATIIKRGGALGHVQPLMVEELFTRDRDSLMSDIKTSLAGYVAEKVKFKVTTSGVSSDFATAMKIAHTMAWQLGMGPSGFVGDYTQIPKEQLSDQIRNTLVADTQQILSECQKEVEVILEREMIVFERFANDLLTKEELDYDQIHEIFSEFGTKTKRKVRKSAALTD
jgi:cell division protease FtsH